MAAAQGASIKEPMEPMGHSSPRAALIYLHATRERDQKIAVGMGKLFADAKKPKKSVGPKGGGVTSGEFPQLSEKLMDSRQRNGDAHIPGHIVITHGDVHRAV